MKKNLKTGGTSASDSNSTALQSLKHVTSSTPRALTESEIGLLRQSKREVAKRVTELADRAGR